jgi:hypothetical protein
MTDLLVAAADLEGAVSSFLRAAEAGGAAVPRGTKAKALAPTTRALAASLRAAFRAQRKALLRHLAAAGVGFPTNESARALKVLLEAVARWDPQFADAASDTFDLFADPLDAGMKASLLAGSSLQLGALGLDTSFDLSNPRAAAWLDGRAAAQVAGINEVTRQKLEKVITDGLSAGDSYTKIAAQIRTMYDSWEGGKLVKDQTFRAESPLGHIQDRAELIATTELGNAYEAGSRAVVDELSATGLSMEQSVLTAGDPCDECQENEDAGWISVDDQFPNDTPPTHPGCRCDVLYQRAEEAA